MAILAAMVGKVFGELLQSFLSWWSVRDQGKKAQQVEDLQDALKKQRAADEAFQKAGNSDYTVGPDGRVHRVGSDPGQTPTLPSTK